MSFEFSADDFSIILALANKVRKELVGAPSQFKDISNKVRSLSIVLQDIDVVLSESELDNEQRKDLERMTISCRNILIDLEKSIDEYGELESSHGDLGKKINRVGKRNIWEPKDIHDFQDRITSNVELLDAYLTRISNKDNVKSKDTNSQSRLWWAARNSNLAMVQQLLDAGANIESKDTNSQTPLCWAARDNNLAIVKLLLDSGANTESKDTNGRTPLWWAAWNSNLTIVKLLLDAGASIESKDTKGQTPLLWAVRDSNLAMVQQLLDAGANIESKNTNSQMPLCWAAQDNNLAIVKLLLDSGANTESKDTNGQTPLWWAARNSNLTIVKLLLDAGASIESKDTNGQTPLWWAARNSNLAMVQLLLDAGANIESKDNTGPTPPRSVTQNLNDNADAEVNVDVISMSRGNSNEDDDIKSPKLKSTAEFLTSGPDTLREAVARFDVQAVKDLLTQAFNDVAEDDFNWLHELVEIGYDYQDIAKLLVDEERESPWIFIEPKERSVSAIIADHHQAFCVHQGGNGLIFSPKLITEDEGIRHIDNCPNSDLPELDSIKREVATFCGLAGVIPVLSDRQEWIGSVAFDGGDSAVASVAYELDLSHTKSTIPDYLLRIEAALERLVNIVLWLQQNGLCCNSFTTLKLSAEVGRVELIQVPFSLISLLVSKLSYLRSSERDREIFNSALKVAKEILDLIYGVERDGATPFHLNNLDLESAERTTVQNCALATQSLCLGLLSYSNAHAGPIKPFFLSRALKRVIFLGIETRLPNGQCLSAELVELTCFGQMIGNAVVAFACTEMPPHTRKYDLLASPEDLIDTWGPGRFVIGLSSTQIERLYAIEIGGGIIRPTAEDATRFHWERGLNFEDLSTQFDSRTKIIIAATELNRSCPLDQSRSWPVCTPSMGNLGTRSDYWRLAEMQAGSQAGQYVMLQFNRTWVKQDGITLKDRQLNATPDTIYLPFLESFWGLQVSLCTGVARRVPVREMLADVMERYVEKRLPVPTLWNDLLTKHKILESFQGPNIEAWFQKLSPELQTLVVRIVRYILSILGDTGYDGQRDELVIACPFREDPFRCFRISCEKDQQFWTRALADSETCATFAYITTKCWNELNGLKCQQSSAAEWRNQVVSLDTAVCQHKCNKEPQDPALTWILQPHIPYWIGKPGSDLKAKVLEPTTQLEMRLSITRSLIPESVRRRFARFKGIPIHRIREKQQSVELNSIPVLILTAQQSDS